VKLDFGAQHVQVGDQTGAVIGPHENEVSPATRWASTWLEVPARRVRAPSRSPRLAGMRPARSRDTRLGLLIGVDGGAPGVPQAVALKHWLVAVGPTLQNLLTAERLRGWCSRHRRSRSGEAGQHRGGRDADVGVATCICASAARISDAGLPTRRAGSPGASTVARARPGRCQAGRLGGRQTLQGCQQVLGLAGTLFQRRQQC